VNALINQLIRDLKASWQKTALLAVLVMVGLIFWIPPLVRAMAGSSASPKAAKTAAAPAPTGNPQKATETDGKPVPFAWAWGQQLLETDPLVRSAEVAGIQSSPFQVDRAQFPPPVLFEEEPPAPKVTPPTPSAPPPVSPAIANAAALQKLVLRSTIVGVNRRAAYINDRLYFEGREIQVDGKSFQITAVLPRKVLLSQGTATFELVLPNVYEPTTSDTPRTANAPRPD